MARGEIQRSAPPESVAGHALVVCLGGPRHGAVYFDTHGPHSWASLRRLAEWHGETPELGRTLGYERTEEKRMHPKWTVEVTVLKWTQGEVRGVG